MEEEYRPSRPVSPVSLGETARDRIDTTHHTASQSELHTNAVLSQVESDISYAQLSNDKALLPLIEATSAGDSFSAKNVRTRKSTEQSKGSKTASWWWWWEIGAAILSASSMFFIIVVLVKVQNTPLQDWTHPIQLNSLIAILTTIGRTAMMVPIASCSSQLKWRHFDHRTQRLHELQLFDNATRGPWGAIKLLSGVHYRSLLASFLALATIAALGIEPSAQQILSFPHSTLSNSTAEIGVANVYTSKSVEVTASASNALWVATGHLLNGLTGTVLQPSFICPNTATDCSWGPFTTLGVCSTFDNVTDVAEWRCIQDAGGLDCVYTFPQQQDYDRNLTIQYGAYNASDDETGMNFRSVTGWALDGSDVIGTMAVINVTSPYDYDNSGHPPAAEVYYSTWYFCMQIYDNLTATASGLTPSLPRVTRNATGGLDVSQKPSFDYLSQLLNTSTLFNVEEDPRVADFGSFLQQSNISKLTQNVADTFSGLVRNIDLGDNYNVTTFTGQAHYSMSFVRVRWPWLILPIGETLLTMVLLVLSISMTRGQALLKSSVIAFFVYPLKGWSEDELTVNGAETSEQLEHLAKGLIASFNEDIEGRLGFIRS